MTIARLLWIVASHNFHLLVGTDLCLLFNLSLHGQSLAQLCLDLVKSPDPQELLQLALRCLLLLNLILYLSESRERLLLTLFFMKEVKESLG